MLIIETPSLLRQEIRRWRLAGKRIALVPTMGNLHNGHLALIDEAQAHADVVVASIFVNPMQFERPDDLARYPRTLQDDCEKLTKHSVDLLFAPAVADVYPQGTSEQTFVEVPGLSSRLEGTRRPGHFRGVTTVVSKLFNLVQPDIACFGEKDYQQLALIRKMVADMGYDITIIGVPTVRAKDGLALSSRNGHLTREERKQAPVLNLVMKSMAARLAEGERDCQQIIAEAEKALTESGLRPDGIAICDGESLLALNNDSQQAVILMAAWLGHTRLIDNQRVALS